jgi:hypothetical protein
MSYHLVLLICLVQAICSTTSAVDWAHLNATSLAQVVPTDFKSITMSQLASIPSDACPGFQVKQLQQIDDGWTNICSGFSTQCIMNIPPLVFQGYQAGCFQNLKTDVFAAITATQLSNVPPATFSKVSTDKLAQLTDSCTGFSADQLQQLIRSIDV